NVPAWPSPTTSSFSTVLRPGHPKPRRRASATAAVERRQRGLPAVPCCLSCLSGAGWVVLGRLQRTFARAPQMAKKRPRWNPFNERPHYRGRSVAAAMGPPRIVAAVRTPYNEQPQHDYGLSARYRFEAVSVGAAQIPQGNDQNRLVPHRATVELAKEQGFLRRNPPDLGHALRQARRYSRR